MAHREPRGECRACRKIPNPSAAPTFDLMARYAKLKSRRQKVNEEADGIGRELRSRGYSLHHRGELQFWRKG